MPRNEGFFMAAYVATVVIYAAYAFSISWRRRKLKDITRDRTS